MVTIGYRAGLLAAASLLGLCASLAAPAHAQTTPAPAPGQAAQMDVVIVTARKRDEAISKVPASITAFGGQTLQAYNIKSFNDYATKAPNLSFSYGGGPLGISDARTIAIRGVTGQNLMGTAGATGFYIDDTPVPGSIDPRILDIDNVEVLKGPQGTLFGASSLGGNVRLITKKPSLTSDSLTVSGEVGATSHGGSPDGGASLVGNLVVAPDRLAVRAVAFVNHDAGYLTRTYPTDPNSPAASDPFLSVPRSSVGDQGAMTTSGASVSIRYVVTDHFEAKLRLMGQQSNDYGFPATFAPLPAFTPQYSLDRAFDVQPKASDLWALPALDLQYRGAGYSLVNSTSYFYRQTVDTEDSTYGTQQILAGPYYGVTDLAAQPYLWTGKHSHRQFTNETRLSFDPIHNLSGTIGVYYSNTHVRFSIPDTLATGLTTASADGAPAWSDDLLWNQQGPGTQEDVSLFGELYYKLLDKFTLTLGGRQYWLNQRADFTANGFLNFGSTPSAPQSNRESGFDPKLGLSYQASEATLVYASASEGFRAGGAQPYLPFCVLPTLPADDITHLRSDTLWTYEAGAKVQLTNPNILVSASGFHIDWSNIQQQVALPCGNYYDINGKSASINGGEFEASGSLARGLTMRLGLGYEATTITNPGALAIVGIMKGSRTLGTPALTATIGASYTRTLFGQTDGFASVDYSYTGDSLSMLNGGGGLESTRPAYGLLNARFGVSRDHQELAVNLRNLTNAKPNLGDIGYDGYAQFNASGVVIPQVATLQPMTVSLQYRRTF